MCEGSMAHCRLPLGLRGQDGRCGNVKGPLANAVVLRGGLSAAAPVVAVQLMAQLAQRHAGSVVDAARY